MKSRYKIAAMPVALGLMASPLLMNCGAANMLADATGQERPDCSDEFKSGDFAKVKGDASFKGFLDASSKFSKEADALEVDLIKACADFGKDLGMKDDELKAEPNGGKGGEKVCGAVAAKMKSMMSVKADVSFKAEPPRCESNIEDLNKCYANCGAVVKPGEFEASCKGGEVSGKCDAECKGSCSVDAGAECKGSCSGSCSGSCDANFSGKCGGKCEGKCDGKDTHGSCSGNCEGSCSASASGSCGGTCSGKCDASCEVKAQAKCSGTCHGGCSVEMKAPSCSGKFEPPSISVDCQAKCSASVKVSCTPGRVTASGKVDTDALKLAEAIRKHIPLILAIGKARAEQMLSAGEAFTSKIQGAVSGAASNGLHAAGCMTAAAEGMVHATASVKVSVSASASFSGGASGGGSAGGGAGGKTIE